MELRFAGLVAAEGCSQLKPTEEKAMQAGPTALRECGGKGSGSCPVLLGSRGLGEPQLNPS